MLSVRVQLTILHVTITPTKPIPEGNVSRKLMTMRNIQIVRHLNRRKQRYNTPTTPTVDTDLTGKAGTQTPVTVTTDPNTNVDCQIERQYYWFGYDR